MTGIDALSIIVAAVALPFVTAILSRPDLNAVTKRRIALAVAVVLGVLSAIISGQIDGIPADVTDWIVRVTVWVAAVAAAGQGFHRQFKDTATALETATAPRRAIGD